MSKTQPRNVGANPKKMIVKRWPMPISLVFEVS